jgi:hypothetical protein
MGEGRQVDFDDVDRRYAELKRQYDSGMINADQFDEQLRALMIQDEQGRWWAKSRETGVWSYYDGSRWVQGDPPRRPPVRTADPGRPPDVHAGPAPGGTMTYGPPSSTPAVSQGLAIVFYAAALFIPLAGAVIWFIYRSNPNPADQAVARNTGIITIPVTSLWFLVCVCLPIIFA